jgi:16S rRNA (guanine527-N7)-methyltransferase
LTDPIHALPEWLDVSRETHQQLEQLLTLVGKWNKSINLVSRGSLAEGWSRHVLDSAQLIHLTDAKAGEWLDIGSGAGFPGMVVAILLAETRPALKVTMVEADRRKATFLSEAARQLGLSTQILCVRIETLALRQATVVSARAFAPLEKLWVEAKRHLISGGIGLFLKGQTYQTELDHAQKVGPFQCDVLASLTQSGSVILRIQEIVDARA